MSRVYFHSPSGGTELHGSERAHLGVLCTDIALGVLAPAARIQREKLADLLAPDYRPPSAGGYHEFQLWRRRLETALSIGRDVFQWRGAPIASSTLLLNTALAVGNDPIRLAARIDGQCEIHGWVDGPNRAWLAGIMREGLDRGVFRTGFWFEDGPDGPRKWSEQGWEQVIEFLLARDDEPVVMSYSVTERFPNREAAGWEPDIPVGWMPDWADGDGYNEWAEMSADAQGDYRRERAEELWSELPEAQQWELAMDGLRRNPGRLELAPDDWSTFMFGHGLSVFDLYAHDRDAHLDAALGVAREVAA